MASWSLASPWLSALLSHPNDVITKALAGQDVSSIGLGER